MICLLQRVRYGRVEVQGQTLGAIEQGMVVLTGFQIGDSAEKIQKMAHKLLHYRLFADEHGKMNLNVQQVGGGVLIVPQFTLAADTRNGLRPNFSSCAPPQQAQQWFDQWVALLSAHYPKVETGAFAADMQVSLCNTGPVTFWLEL
ncbi:MAG: D-tyrosyl-tRNA(Tyr) deacylase [Thiotrichales bacterium]|nr:D-tyrosyl-tRNA(Tyr) deacylase [Thiotrichales bacterium]